MNRSRLTVCFVFVASVLVSSLAVADVSLPKIFGNGMVLQRGLAAPVWGWAEAGEEVTVQFGDQKKTATADSEGAWSVRLDSQKENAREQTLTVSGKNKVEFSDVLIGDVWICSGQSNMEWAVRNSLNPAEELKSADHPNIRLFNVPGHTTSPVAKVELPGGEWQICTSNTVGGFSAVGYFFGRRLHQESKVPIGLIGTNWGGTRIEPWTPPVGFRQIPELKGIADEVDKYDAETKVGGGQPAAIYNSMVHPLVPYGVRGAIWYQGESNGNEGESYFHKMQALIKGWRSVWKQDDFPLYFYFVQLADFQQPNDSAEGGNGWAKLREAQRKSLTIPHTGMAVIIDIGEANDIHPRNKQDVGSRLAQWALRDVYKKDVVPCGPLFRELKIEDGKARVAFDHAGDGLSVGHKEGLTPTKLDKDGKLQRFAVAGEDKKWHWAETKIDGDSVLVWSKDVPAPVAVRYAYSMNPEGANLYNSLGLPASPFHTDDW